ncbi:unnamed protein product [Spirodela intermedia]|uniref:Tf2-1-like SH3-like domain-containing protein n=1 Tax=Spirodela intermedia TaxID=51605 RepID=A0A7I8KYC3_SPIIN|nr:unnamed protein product [Spirodela intermedia]
MVSIRKCSILVSNWVYLKLRPDCLQSIVCQPNEKLTPRFFRSYQITERVSLLAYCLQLPPTAQLHPIFHVSQIKKAIGEAHHSILLPPQLDADLNWNISPQQVLNICSTTEETKAVVQLDHFPKEEATWESVPTLQRQFPEFILGDKVTLAVGCNVRFQGSQTYSRHRKEPKTSPQRD